MLPPGARHIPDPVGEMNRMAAERKLPPAVRTVLDQSVTVVRPGETLIIRFDTGTINLQQHSEYQRALDEITECRELPFKVLVVVGDELGIAEPGSGEAL